MNDKQSVLIRRATSRDTEGLLNCLRSAFQPYRQDYTDLAFEATVVTRDTLGQRLAAMMVFVASRADVEIVGTIACEVLESRTGHVRGTAVHPAWQGCGVAQQLLEAVEAELRARKCSRICLETTAPLMRAARFYERQGFRASGVVTNFFGMPLFEYVKPLPQD